MFNRYSDPIVPPLIVKVSPSNSEYRDQLWAQSAKDVALKACLLVALIFGVAHALTGCADDGNQPPRLLNLQDYLLNTNQNFQLEITAFDPDQDFIEFNFTLSPPPPTPTETSGGVPTLQRVSTTQAVFSWTPGVADAGQYTLTISVEDPGGGRTEETITLTVAESSGVAGVWVRFVEPLGDATILDLTRTPCLEENVRLQSDQLSDDEIQLELVSPSPSNASLILVGSKTYRLTWCPQESELSAQLNFPFLLRASTTRGFSPVDKSYLVRVRRQAASDCPGQPPMISHQRPQDYMGVMNVALTVDIIDDIGVKSAPTISYQVRERGAPPQLEGMWETLLMTGEGGSGLMTQWSALLPPPRMPLESTIFYRFLVNDDDDPDGVVCDHSVESELYQVNYMWDPSQAGSGAGLCETCIDDIQCGGPGDRCLIAADGGGVCGRNCDHANACPADFQCQQVMNNTGAMVAQCVSDNACGETCLADFYDGSVQSGLGNNTPESAAPLMSGSYEQLSVCAGDLDYYQVELSQGQSLTARIEFSSMSGDLDLEVREAMNLGTFPVRRSVSSNDDFEEVSIRCVAQNTTALIYVYGFEGAQNTYSLSLMTNAEPCESEACYPDEHEGDSGNNSVLFATFADLDTSYSGRVCPTDVDFYGVSLTAGQEVRATLSLDSTRGDLALDLLDEDQNLLGSADSPGRDREVLEFTAPSNMEVYFKVLSPQANANIDYQLTISRLEAVCQDSTMCSDDEYCAESRGCVPSACSGSCSGGYACVSPLAGRVPVADSGVCAPLCTNDSECRRNERCKSFESFTSRCAPSGESPVAGSCQSFADCADAMICLPVNAGYCAAGGCFDDGDCAPDTLCTSLGGVQGCLKRCVNDTDCGRADLRCLDFPTGRACAP